MKTEDEVRRYLQDLLTCVGKPCDCRGTSHDVECAIGGKMMRAVAETLSWVLGENEEMQPVVDEMHRGAREHLAAKGRIPPR